MNIFIVDSNPAALSNLTDKVRKVVPDAGISCFSSGAQALSAAKNSAVDIIFLETELSDMAGMDLAKKLLVIREKTNVIFATQSPDYALEAFRLYASGYLMKPISTEDIAEALHYLRMPVLSEKPARLKVVCFGEFAVFYQGRAVAFPRKKAMELFAYLVDRRGNPVSLPELAEVFWEDGDYDASRCRQLQTYISCLTKVMRDLGCADVLARHFNAISIKPDTFDCDYYQCLAGDENALRNYMGEYMRQYSWAEDTNGTLAYKYLE